MVEFWKHSLALAVTRKNIAQTAGSGLNSEPQNIEYRTAECRRVVSLCSVFFIK
jgi:hypothetical protein